VPLLEGTYTFSVYLYTNVMKAVGLNLYYDGCSPSLIKRKNAFALVAHGLPVYTFFQSFIHENLIVTASLYVLLPSAWTVGDLICTHTLKQIYIHQKLDQKYFKKNKYKLIDKNDQNCVFSLESSKSRKCAFICWYSGLEKLVVLAQKLFTFCFWKVDANF